jgi:hypothetical protein
MTGEPDDTEAVRVLALPFPARYEYFVEHAAASGTVWSLADEQGWVLMGDEYGRVYVPVWPHPRFAAACIADNWAATEPRPIGLTEWREKWLPGIAADERLPAVFPTPAGRAIVVEPHELERNLEEQLSGRERGEQAASTNGHSSPPSAPTSASAP